MKKYVIRKINNVKCWVRIGGQQTDLLIEKGEKLEVDKYNLPIFGSIELTGKCNLNCVHCYASDERTKDELNLKEIKKTIDGLAEMGCLFLQLTGGECTFRNDFLNIYKYAYDKGIYLSISTNGTLIKDQIIDTFRRRPPYRIFVSLYGSNPSIHDKVTQIKGSFNETLNGLKKLKAAKLNVFINCLAMKNNIKNATEIKSLANKLKIKVFFYSKLVPKLNSDQSPLKLKADEKVLDKYLPKNSSRNKFFGLNKNYQGECMAGYNNFHIDCQGNIMPCKMVRKIKFNVKNGDIKTSWQEMMNKQTIIRKAIKTNCVIVGCEL